MDRFIRGKVLGKGSFGVCSLVTRKTDGKQFVVKEIDVSRMPKAERDTAELEAKLLMALNHPNIVRCVECFTSNNKLCIVMDYCSEGDLYGLLQKRRGSPLPEDTILDWFVQLCLSLKHVHDRKILHRDIKTQNVFVSSGGLLKLGDFGVSKVLNSTWQLAATAVGTPYYLSPEICQNKRYNQKSDIWSLGCVLYEMTVGRHAFEAPNMRALIQKIVKGTYNPVPSTRSKELRDLIGRIFVLNWEKRPSINDILSTPIVKARITKFLSATLHEHEFSHTIIHGKPKPGQIVVQSQPQTPLSPALPPPAFPSPQQAPKPAPAAPQRSPPPPIRRSSPPVSAAPIRRSSPPVSAAPVRKSSPVSAANAPVRRSSPPTPPPINGLAAARGSPANRPAGVRAAPTPMMHAPSPAAGRQSPTPAVPARPGSRPVSGANSRPSSAASRVSAPQAPIPRAAPQAGGARPASGLDGAAAQKRFGGEAAVRRSRELAAIQAQREVERMKLEDQRKKIEADRARLNSERRRAEAAREDKARKAAILEEQQRKAAAVEMQRKKEAERQRKKLEEEARKKEADRAVREKERNDMHAKMAAQKKEYYDRQQQAARNRAAHEDEVRGPKAAPMERKSPPVEVYEKPRQRKQWQSPEITPDASPRSGSPATPPSAKGERNGGGDLTPEARRAVWEEMRAGAERNKRAAAEVQQGPGGLAAFLGVPSDTQEKGAPQRPSHANGARPLSPAAPEVTLAPSDPYERRRNKLEAEAQAREAEIQAFQRQHWQEMKGAAARNRAALLAEMRDGGGKMNGEAFSPGQPLPPIPPKQEQEQGQDGADSPEQQQQRPEEDFEFAAMLKDMQDVLVHEGEASESQGEEDDELYNDGKYVSALSGRFMLNGQEVPLPVHESDSLAMKIEALRMYLEQQLDTMPFLKVYRRLESLSTEDDEEEDEWSTRVGNAVPDHEFPLPRNMLRGHPQPWRNTSVYPTLNDPGPNHYSVYSPGSTQMVMSGHYAAAGVPPGTINDSCLKNKTTSTGSTQLSDWEQRAKYSDSLRGSISPNWKPLTEGQQDWTGTGSCNRGTTFDPHTHVSAIAPYLEEAERAAKAKFSSSSTAAVPRTEWEAVQVGHWHAGVSLLTLC